MQDKYERFQLIWGIALVAMGIGVFYRIPQIMPKIEMIEQFYKITGYIRFCFYIMGILLIIGGAKKIYTHYSGS
jgi:hypothetical protein